jgi:hypothetical protein
VTIGSFRRICASIVIFSGRCDVYSVVDTMRRVRPTERTNGGPVRAATGWGVAVRLAVVVSVAAALFAATFAGRLADSTLICAVIVFASLAGWLSAERAPTPAPIRLRRR